MMMMRMILPNLDQVVGIIVVDDIYVDMVEVVDIPGWHKNQLSDCYKRVI